MNIQEVVENFNEYIGRIPKGAEYIANNLRTDKLQNALDAILDFSEGVIWLVDANQLLKENNVNSELNIEKINEFLGEINEGLEKQDYVIVADMFEYEIAPFFANIEPVKD